MGGFRKAGSVVGWIWRRINDLSTLSWLFPGGATLLAVCLAAAQELPLALWFVFGLAAFCFALIGTILWHERPSKRSGYALTDANLASLARIMGAPPPADGPIIDRVGVLNAALYMIFHEWDRSPNDLTATDQIVLISGKFRQMVQDAIDGNLTICVKKQRYFGNVVDLGQKYWEDHHLDWLSSRDGEVNAVPNDGGKLTQTFNPVVRKSDIEKLYGPGPQMITLG